MRGTAGGFWMAVMCVGILVTSLAATVCLSMIAFYQPDPEKIYPVLATFAAGAILMLMAFFGLLLAGVPVAITLATSGFVFGMLGFLSLNLGIFNLLPIPVLDGGAIFLLLLEGLLALIGLSISATVRDRIQQVGFVMVLLLMVFVLANDALKTFGPSREPEKPPATATPAPAK